MECIRNQGGVQVWYFFYLQFFGVRFWQIFNFDHSEKNGLKILGDWPKKLKKSYGTTKTQINVLGVESIIQKLRMNRKSSTKKFGINDIFIDMNEKFQKKMFKKDLLYAPSNLCCMLMRTYVVFFK